MSTVLYIGVDMTIEERSAWASAIALFAVPGWYFIVTLNEARDSLVADIDYQGRLLWNIGITIITVIALTILLAIGNAVGTHVSAEIRAEKLGEPVDHDELNRELTDIGRSDERDKRIGRRGESIGGIVLGIGAVAPFALAMLEREQFWIAQSLYAAFVVSGITGAIVKIVAYRKGI
jgi:hypothetical protein